jgi:cytochrome bd-type quinol oxidase subunit 2
MLLCYFKILPSWGFLSVVTVMAVTFSVYLGTLWIMLWKEGALRIRVPGWLSDPYFYLMLAVFILSLDFWAWGKAYPQWAGMPVWLGYFVVLSALQTVLMIRLVRRLKEGTAG